MPTKLLTIAIPTYNRPAYLSLCIEQIISQLSTEKEYVEIYVSDNSCDDESFSVIEKFRNKGFEIKYEKNENDIGADANIAQCFNRATGKYVLILGDDDLLLSDAIDEILHRIRRAEYGIIFMQPYGYNDDYIKEKPARFLDSDIEYLDKNKFLIKIANHCTFISANIINKSIIPHVDTNQYTWSKLVQTYLILEAMIASDKNLYMRKYLVACKRNNSGEFNFLTVFAEQLTTIFSSFSGRGFRQATYRTVLNRMLMVYFPYHLIGMRNKGSAGAQLHENMKEYFSSYPRYWIFVYPLLRLPLRAARWWTYILVTTTRALSGEMLRVLAYSKNALIKWFQDRKSLVG